MRVKAAPKPRFFRTPADFRRWLERNHAKAPELLVGFYKRDTGKASITWPESVREALCFGWIDGIRRSLNAESYTIRFTPRRRGSTWSAVNVRFARELIAEGRMQPAGLAVFNARGGTANAPYSYENRDCTLAPPLEKRFRANKAAWAYYSGEAPWYRRTTAFWVMDAKKEETRLRRLEQLIADSAGGRRIKGLAR